MKNNGALRAHDAAPQPAPAAFAAAATAGTPDVRLVALDMDGTILERGRLIVPELVDALRRLAAAGVRTTTATGRPLAFQIELLARHGLGASSGVPHALMADERELFLLDSLVDGPVDGPVDGADGPTGEGGGSRGSGGSRRGDPVYVPHGGWNDAIRERWQRLHPVATSWIARAQQEAARRGWPSEPHLTDEVAYQRGLPTLAFSDRDRARQIHHWLAAEVQAAGDALGVNRNNRLVQLHDSIAGKGRVLLELARLWSLRPDQVLAVGDSANDFSMVDGRYGFRGATTGNADDEIKEAVRAAGGYVAAAPIGEGVLEILRRLTVLGAVPAAG